MIEYLDVLRGQGLTPPSMVAAFVVGSTARGWAHGTSDIDVVVVLTEPLADDRTVPQDIPLGSGWIETIAFEQDGRQWQVKFWLERQLDQLLGKVTWDRFHNDRKEGDWLTDLEQLFLSRLRTCRPLSGSSWIEEQRSRLDGSAFGAFMIKRMLFRMNSSMEAAMGQLASGNHEDAVLLARFAFEDAVEAVLMNHGDFESGPKWRARRFKAVAPSLLSFDDYWAIQSMRTYDPAAPEKWIDQIAKFGERVSLEVTG